MALTSAARQARLLPTLLLAFLLQPERRTASRVNPIAPVLILIPIAVVIALGLAAAWFAYCQYRGLYPALDMPSFSSGGTWKVYCA